ncbi:hypothetical protein EOL96_01060 [Candidatus Saccharibacteria bacterium]|nr:hypothetical protein [Candidatus Saccharibacteria bacterium]
MSNESKYFQPELPLEEQPASAPLRNALGLRGVALNLVPEPLDQDGSINLREHYVALQSALSLLLTASSRNGLARSGKAFDVKAVIANEGSQTYQADKQLAAAFGITCEHTDDRDWRSEIAPYRISMRRRYTGPKNTKARNEYKRKLARSVAVFTRAEQLHSEQ